MTIRFMRNVSIAVSIATLVAFVFWTHHGLITISAIAAVGGSILEALDLVFMKLTSFKSPKISEEEVTEISDILGVSVS